MKKVESNIWEHGEYSVIRKYSPATQKPAYYIYFKGEPIEIRDSMKEVKNYLPQEV